MTRLLPGFLNRDDLSRARFLAELIYVGHEDVTVAEQEEYRARLAAANANMKKLAGNKEKSVLLLATIDGERVWLDKVTGWHAETPVGESKVKDLPTTIEEAFRTIEGDLVVDYITLTGD